VEALVRVTAGDEAIEVDVVGAEVVDAVAVEPHAVVKKTRSGCPSPSWGDW